MEMRTISSEDGDRALLEGCGLVASLRRDWLVLSGEDRLRFLNGLVTCDVRNLPLGTGRYGFFTGPKGRIIADTAIRGEKDELLLDVPEGQGEAIVAHMLKYRVADCVQARVAEPMSDFVVAGPSAASFLERVLGLQPPATAWCHQSAGEVRISREDWIGVPSFRLYGSARAVARVRSGLSAAGAVEVARGSIDLVRVERGRPLFGVDFDSDCFPQETGLEERAVSYTKGCYLGQEVVARIHYRGGVNRQLRGLRGAIGDDLVVGEKVLREDEAVGAITTAAYSPSVGAPIALAILHRKVEPGAKLRLETGSPVTVVEVPFVVDAVRSN